MSGSMSKRYPAELRERAVQMVSEIPAGHESGWAAMTRVAGLPGIGTPRTVRNSCRQAEVDVGARPGVTSEDSVELERLRRENARLRRANAILKAASAFFAAEPGRPLH
jgi:transposase